MNTGASVAPGGAVTIVYIHIIHETPERGDRDGQDFVLLKR
jgi:hypothetical protein